MTRLVLIMALTFATLTLPSVVYAAPRNAAPRQLVRDALVVRGGATCIEARPLAVQIETWLHSAHVAADVTIEVDGSATDPRNATFHLVQDGITLAHRAFEPGPERCDHFVAAIGLSIALALKASLLDGLGEPLRDDPQARQQGWSLAASGLLTFGALPGLAPGVDLRAELAVAEIAVLRFGVLGSIGFDKQLEHIDGRFDAALLGVHVDGCVNASLARDLSWRACVGANIGGLGARGRGEVVAQSKTSIVGWFTVINAMELRLDLSDHWSLGLDLLLLAPLRALSVGVHDPGGAIVDARNLPAIGLGVGFGPRFRL